MLARYHVLSSISRSGHFSVGPLRLDLDIQSQFLAFEMKTFFVTKNAHFITNFWTGTMHESIDIFNQERDSVYQFGMVLHVHFAVQEDIAPGIGDAIG